ncbi:MAG: hypothetical protein JWR73_3192 [Tardiphaga sp.]|jgi:hypothetical protein|nr:hypothetical protein [Tardiphaga sp.]MDB5627390.1 hypothetical protein [Tardiphaga sp.]MDB5630006.1 hypothetical protein [Tardiphaga sp.]
MKLKFVLAGLAALGGAALASGSASAAMPNGLPGVGAPANVEQVRLVCDAYGRCFRTPGYGYGGGPRFYGGGPRYYGGGGYGRPRFYGGGGYGRPRFYGGGRGYGYGGGYGRY